MKIGSSGLQNTNAEVKQINTSFNQKISKDELKELKEQISYNSQVYMYKSVSLQSNILNLDEIFEKNYEDFQNFLNGIGYEGKPIAELSEDEAAKLVAEDGIFGIDQTSQRIADFVINNANGDEERLRAGRAGMLEGFKMAEEIWGSKLPEISQKTMQRATELVDRAMSDLGFSIINEEV